MTDSSSAGSPDSLRADLEACRAEVRRLRLLLDVQATIDLATGLLNAQGMLEPIKGAMDRLGRHQESCALCLVDVPGFEAASTKTRDAAMAHAGALLAASLRGVDRVGRLGESAFLVVLPQLTEEFVGVVLERMSNSLGVVPYDGPDGPIDMSPAFTVVLSPTEPVAAESLLDEVAAARVDAAPGAPVIVRASA